MYYCVCVYIYICFQFTVLEKMLFVHKWPKIIKNWENYYFPESVFFFECNILKTICSTCIAVLFYLGIICVVIYFFKFRISNSLLEVFGFLSDLVGMKRYLSPDTTH